MATLSTDKNSLFCFNYSLKEIQNFYTSRVPNFLNLIYVYNSSHQTTSCNYLNFIESKKDIQSIIKNYYSNVKNMLKSSPLTNDIHIPSSQSIKTKLFDHQLSDLMNLVKYENNVSNSNKGFKIYYNAPQTGKSFVLMQLTKYKLTNVITDNLSLYLDTNIVVIPSYISFQWENYLKYFYNDSYLIIDNQTKLKKFKNAKIDTINAKIIVVVDGVYNDFMNHINTHNVHYNRLIYDSILNLNNVNVDSTTYFTKYLVTNNYLNMFIPYENLFLQTRRIKNKNNFNTLIYNTIHKKIEALLKLKVEIDILNILFYYYKENDYNHTIVNIIYSKYYFVRSQFKYKLENDENTQRDKIFETEINATKITYNKLLKELNDYYLEFTSPDQSYFCPAINYNLIPIAETTKPCMSQINELINKKQFNILIKMLNMKVLSTSDIIQQFARTNDEHHTQCIKQRLTTNQCLVCFEKPEIEIVTDCCQQLFCVSCFTTCYSSNNKCPLCRTNIKLENILINKDNSLIPNLVHNFNNFDDVLKSSSAYTRAENLKNLLELIIKNDSIPKVIINFTDYNFKNYKDSRLKLVKRYQKSNEYLEIIEVLQELKLSYFDLTGNLNTFKTNYLQFLNPKSNMLNVFINNNNFTHHKHFNYKECGLGFNCCNYVIDYNLDGYEIQETAIKYFKKVDTKTKHLILEPFEDCIEFNKLAHLNSNHKFHKFKIKGY